MNSSDYIYTQSGRFFLPCSMKASDIVLEDIAFGLSRIFRFNGQSTVSVLRHSIGLSATFKAPQNAYYALFHDATEAYMMDIPVPLKPYVNSQWHRNYQRIERLIFDKFGVPTNIDIKLVVGDADKSIVEYEMEANDTSMFYPDRCTMSEEKRLELTQHYRWDLHDRYLPSLWLEKVLALARQYNYFESLAVLF